MKKMKEINEVKYCKHCGNELVKKLRKVEYDQETGEPKQYFSLVCPGLARDKTFWNAFLGVDKSHDRYDQYDTGWLYTEDSIFIPTYHL